jgi:hypothetical protein
MIEAMAQFLLLFIGLGAPERVDDDLTRAYAGEWTTWMSDPGRPRPSHRGRAVAAARTTG